MMFFSAASSFSIAVHLTPRPVIMILRFVCSNRLLLSSISSILLVGDFYDSQRRKKQQENEEKHNEADDRTQRTLPSRGDENDRVISDVSRQHAADKTICISFMFVAHEIDFYRLAISGFLP